MTLVIPASLRSQATTARTHFYALCWKIQATHATYRFTNWPHALDLREADDATHAFFTYTPVEGADATAVRRTDELEAENKEIRGVVTSTTIKADDLRARRFDGAQVDEFLVDSRLPQAGYVSHNRYFIKEVKYDRGVWLADVEGLAGRLVHRTGDPWSYNCRTDLFSPACGLLVGDWQESGEILAIEEQRIAFTIDWLGPAPGTWAPDGYATDGVVVWTAGANSGVKNEIKEYIGSGGSPAYKVILHEPTPFDFDLADTFDIQPGCNKDHGAYSGPGDCKNKFSNLDNYQGEPFIPGRDRAIQGIPIS